MVARGGPKGTARCYRYQRCPQGARAKPKLGDQGVLGLPRERWGSHMTSFLPAGTGNTHERPPGNTKVMSVPEEAESSLQSSPGDSTFPQTGLSRAPPHPYGAGLLNSRGSPALVSQDCLTPRGSPYPGKRTAGPLDYPWEPPAPLRVTAGTKTQVRGSP